MWSKNILLIVLLALILFFVFFRSSLTLPEHLPQRTKPLIPHKVALCLSGQFRNWKSCLLIQQSLLIQPLSCDVFICADDDLPAAEKEQITQLYQPKDIQWHSAKHIPPNDFHPNTLLMFTRIYLCDKARQNYEAEHGFIYDIVIRMRADMVMNEMGPIPERPILCDRVVYFPKWHQWDFIFDCPIFGKTDQLFWANSKTMTEVVNILPWLYKLLWTGYEGCRVPEGLLRNYLKEQNLITTAQVWKTFKYDFHFEPTLENFCQFVHRHVILKWDFIKGWGKCLELPAANIENT